MPKYYLNLPYEFEAFQLGIELEIINYVSEDSFSKNDNDELEAIVYEINFDDEDQMYAFDKEIKSRNTFIWEKNKEKGIN